MREDVAGPEGSRVEREVMQHSPGPWRVDADTRPGMGWNRHIMADASAAICFMAHSGGRDNARDDANARLVAAAPTLLAALLDAEDALFRCEFAGQGGGAVQASLLNVRAAIRKAVAGDA